MGNRHDQREGFGAGPCVGRQKEEDGLGDGSHGFISYLGSELYQHGTITEMISSWIRNDDIRGLRGPSVGSL